MAFLEVCINALVIFTTFSYRQLFKIMEIYAMAPSSFRNMFFLFLFYSLLVDITMVDVLTFSTATLCHDHQRSALLRFKQSLSLNNSASYDSSAFPKTVVIVAHLKP